MRYEVSAVAIASGVSLVVSIVGGVATFRTQERRLRAELRTEFMAEEAIRLLLKHQRWTLRSFSLIRSYVRGFSDEELRRLLIRSGALCFSAGGKEWWGLRERNQDRLDKAASKEGPAPPDD